MSTSPSATPQPDASYVYGIVPGGVTVPSLHGFGAVRSIHEGDLQALVSSVPAADWAPQALASRETIAERAQLHQHILGALLTHCTPLPMRMGTILHGDQRVRELLRRVYPLLAETLDGVQGRTEWSIRLTVDRTALAARVQRDDEELRSLSRRLDGANEASRHMLEKRRDRETAQRVDGETEELAQRVRRNLAAVAAKRAVLAPRDDCALNESLLVEHARTRELTQRAAALNARLDVLGKVQLTGPWPPYSFAPVVQLGREMQEVEPEDAAV